MQAQYNATQLLTQREQVSYTIRQSLEQRARDFNILLDDVSIVISTLNINYLDSLKLHGRVF